MHLCSSTEPRLCTLPPSLSATPNVIVHLTSNAHSHTQQFTPPYEEAGSLRASEEQMSERDKEMVTPYTEHTRHTRVVYSAQKDAKGRGNSYQSYQHTRLSLEGKTNRSHTPQAHLGDIARKEN